MINLDDWRDYKRSFDRIKAIEELTSDGKVSSLLMSGVMAYITRNVILAEDRDYALELIGEKTPNPTSN